MPEKGLRFEVGGSTLQGSRSATATGVLALLILVRDNNVDQALRVLKKKLQREGFYREIKEKAFYEKPSEKRARERSDAIKRYRKLVQKQLQREGLSKPPNRPSTKRRPTEEL